MEKNQNNLRLSQATKDIIQAACVEAWKSMPREDGELCVAYKKGLHSICKTCELRANRKVKRETPKPYANVIVKSHVIAGQGRKVAGESPLARQLRMVEFELYKLRMKYDPESRARHSTLAAQRKDILRAMCIKTR